MTMVVQDLYRVSNWLWLAFWVLWLVWGWISTRRRPVAGGQRGISPTWWLLLALAAYLWLKNHFTQIHLIGIFSFTLWPGNLPAAVAGLVLEILGFALTVWARYHLGTFWSGAVVLRQGHRVVNSGPYRLVRHPIYSGLILSLAGTFLMAGETLMLAVWAAAAAVMWFKARAEERLLAGVLGDEYVCYRQRTRMLIPWLV